MTPSDATTTGEVVRSRREELGLTKAELARRSHLTRSSIHEIEAGQRTHLQARTVQALNRALGLPPGTLSRGPVQRDAALSATLRRELEDRLADDRYETVLGLLMRVAERIDELEERLGRPA